MTSYGNGIINSNIPLNINVDINSDILINNGSLTATGSITNIGDLSNNGILTIANNDLSNNGVLQINNGYIQFFDNFYTIKLDYGYSVGTTAFPVVNFKFTFNQAPSVLITPIFNSTVNVLGRVTSITTTSFTYVICNNNGALFPDIPMYWVAVGN